MLWKFTQILHLSKSNESNTKAYITQIKPYASYMNTYIHKNNRIENEICRN